MRINIKSLTEQHASWLASNPVIGCPMNCAYCFLKPAGLNGIKPKILFSSREALDSLTSSKFYREDIPVATGTRTDYFATPENINYLKQYLVEYNKRKLKNPLVIITKKTIPDDVINLLIKLQNKGSIFIIFLSYSGSDESIEKGINPSELKNNFIRLKKANLNIIHYWRPFIPQNSTKKIMTSVLEYVVKYAKASVVTGLRLTPEMQKQFWFWKNAQDLDIDFSNVEGIWPHQVQNYLKEFMQKYPQYPIFYASSCAIAYSLGIPDYNGFYNTEVCASNSCPILQRTLCKKFFAKHIVTDETVKTMFRKLKMKDIKYKLDQNKKVLTLFQPLDHDKIVNLTQSLKILVKAKEEDGGYGWGSSVTQRKPYYL